MIPQSSTNVTTPEGEGGGGNRISEEQIKSYLDHTLGEAPRPPWGVPGGWGAYLAGECSPSAAACSLNMLRLVHVHSCEERYTSLLHSCSQIPDGSTSVFSRLT